VLTGLLDVDTLTLGIFPGVYWVGRGSGDEGGKCVENYSVYRERGITGALLNF
jgi:hypothetical protein